MEMLIVYLIVYPPAFRKLLYFKTLIAIAYMVCYTAFSIQFPFPPFLAPIINKLETETGEWIFA